MKWSMVDKSRGVEECIMLILWDIDWYMFLTLWGMIIFFIDSIMIKGSLSDVDIKETKVYSKFQ